MAEDAYGNDLTAVGLPVTGFVGLAYNDLDPLAVLPTATTGADPELTLTAYNVTTMPSGWRKLGLLTTDGGPSWTLEPTGDAIEFWQDGYKIPSGLANCTLTIKLAETDPMIQELRAGAAPDVNGMIDVDAGGHARKYAVLVEEAFKNGVIRRRVGDMVTLLSLKEDRNERGTPLAYEAVFNFGSSPTFGNKHFREWLIPAA